MTATNTADSPRHAVRAGVGGWTYDAWEETFYPADLPKKQQLEYASRRLTAIEINGTYYGLQKPAVYRKWADETPADFVFAVKAHRTCTSRKTPDGMKESVDAFLASGVTELGARLGPINWQFDPRRKYDAEYFGAFLSLLPKEHAGVRLRHAIEVRDRSFEVPAFDDLCRKHGCAIVAADDDDWPQPDRPTADFAYLRLQRSRADQATGYPPGELDTWAATLKGWAATRDVFAFIIAGAKERNPAAAMALIARV